MASTRILARRFGRLFGKPRATSRSVSGALAVVGDELLMRFVSWSGVRTRLEVQRGQGATAAGPRWQSWRCLPHSVAIDHPSRQAMPSAHVAAVPLGTDQVLQGGGDRRCI